MGALRLLVGAIRGIGFVIKAAIAVVLAVVAWSIVDSMVQSGQLPAEPLDVASMGLPATVGGIPTVYAVGIVLLALLVVFGEGGSASGGGGAHGGGGGGGGDGGE